MYLYIYCRFPFDESYYVPGSQKFSQNLAINSLKKISPFLKLPMPSFVIRYSRRYLLFRPVHLPFPLLQVMEPRTTTYGLSRVVCCTTPGGLIHIDHNMNESYKSVQHGDPDIHNFFSKLLIYLDNPTHGSAPLPQKQTCDPSQSDNDFQKSSLIIVDPHA